MKEIIHYLETGERWGQYIILEKIDVSDIQISYSAVDPAIDRHATIKVIKGPYSQNNKDILRFKELARKLAVLHHKHIVPFYGIGLEREMYYVATSYIPGYTMQDWLMNDRVLDEEQAMRMMTQVISALEFAEQNQIWHLNIRPIRFISDWDGIISVANIGLLQARHHLVGHEKYDSMSFPHYAAPEQISGKPVDHRTDIYSLGATLFHLMTSSPPFEAKTNDQVCLAHLQEPFPEKKAQEAGISQGWIDFIAKMMEKEPEKRFQTYPQVASALLRLA